MKRLFFIEFFTVTCREITTFHTEYTGVGVQDWTQGPNKAIKRSPLGWMAERSKARAWKVRIRQKRIVGSNPTPSAIKIVQDIDLYC